jgi:hypothetical protein
MALLERAVSDFTRGYAHPELQPSYADLIRRDLTNPPPGYPWQNVNERLLAARMTDGLIALAETWADTPDVLSPTAPHPRPELRIVPRF